MPGEWLRKHDRPIQSERHRRELLAFFWCTGDDDPPSIGGSSSPVLLGGLGRWIERRSRKPDTPGWSRRKAQAAAKADPEGFSVFPALLALGSRDRHSKRRRALAHFWIVPHFSSCIRFADVPGRAWKLKRDKQLSQRGIRHVDHDGDGWLRRHGSGDCDRKGDSEFRCPYRAGAGRLTHMARHQLAPRICRSPRRGRVQTQNAR